MAFCLEACLKGVDVEIQVQIPNQQESSLLARGKPVFLNTKLNTIYFTGVLCV